MQDSLEDGEQCWGALLPVTSLSPVLTPHPLPQAGPGNVPSEGPQVHLHLGVTSWRTSLPQRW